MKQRARKRKIKEILEYLAYHSGDRGTLAWVDPSVFLLNDQNDNKSRAVALLLGELLRVEIIESRGATLWDDVPLDGAEDMFNYFQNAEIRITNKGMAKLRPRDPLYREYATPETNPGFLYRFIHEWLPGIAVGCAITAFAWWLNSYLTKP